MRKSDKAKIVYEPEADILMWEMSKKAIDFASEVDNMVIHFSKDGVPVLVEILEASKFLSKANSLIGEEKSSRKKLASAR
ncbi:MAG: DUF2283 domain-containing protein [Candidatus Kryptoniota bacterium]